MVPTATRPRKTLASAIVVKKFRGAPRPVGRGGQYESPAPREVIAAPCLTAEEYVRSGQSARDTERHAREIEDLYPDADLSPHSITATQDRREDRRRWLEAEQAELRAAAAVWDTWTEEAGL